MSALTHIRQLFVTRHDSLTAREKWQEAWVNGADVTIWEALEDAWEKIREYERKPTRVWCPHLAIYHDV